MVAVAARLVIGGAGFIGSHLVRELLERYPDDRVLVVDNLRSGSWSFLNSEIKQRRVEIFEASIEKLSLSESDFENLVSIFHLASNAEIALAQTQPDVDFWHGTSLTNYAVELWRMCEHAEFVYASGSGVYGDAGDSIVLSEDDLGYPIISTYAASKLAGEALVESYAFLFDRPATIFRFGNVVGPNQTHGVVLDFVAKLLRDPSQLEVWGDGTQTKPYVHVSDIVRGLIDVRNETETAAKFNLATTDVVSVAEIIDIVIRVTGIEPVRIDFGTESRGWKGDVPVVLMDSSKAHAFGWRPTYSGHAALEDAARANYEALGGKTSRGPLAT